MHHRFKRLIADLHGRFETLLAMPPVKVRALPPDVPKSGVYLLSEAGDHLYAGRSNRLRQRLQQHGRPSSGHNSAPFAFLLARVEIYRHYLREIKRISPGTPATICSDSREVWDALADEVDGTPESMYCCCGGLSAPRPR